MRITEPSFSLTTQGLPLNLSLGVSMLQTIEANARISHRSEDAQTSSSWPRFIKAVVLEHGDWSVCEHAYVTANIRTSRGITHETVRHRLFSYTQESTRFVNYTKPGFGAEYISSSGVRPEDLAEWEEDYKTADTIYRKWLGRKYAPQIARDHLPHGLASTISMTGNLRAWRWFFQARVTQEAHPDMRLLVRNMLESFKANIPLLYDDITPNEKQTISMAKVH